MEGSERFRCAECGFEVDEVIATLPSGALAHYGDREFPGRCVLAFATHAEKLEELSESQLTRLVLDVQRAGLAIRAATGAPRINYAVLGNAAPHIHVHLIPRGGPTDRHGTDTPWGPPPPTVPVPPEEAARLRGRIASALRGGD